MRLADRAPLFSRREPGLESGFDLSGCILNSDLDTMEFLGIHCLLERLLDLTADLPEKIVFIHNPSLPFGTVLYPFIILYSPSPYKREKTVFRLKNPLKGLSNYFHIFVAFLCEMLYNMDRESVPVSRPAERWRPPPIPPTGFPKGANIHTAVRPLSTFGLGLERKVCAMKKIIRKKEYNTDTAQLVASRAFSYYGDPAGYEEKLYQTPDGFYFLYGIGGEASPYPDPSIKAISKANAQKWQEEQA